MVLSRSDSADGSAGESTQAVGFKPFLLIT
jgi:hypothetical protein